VARRPDRHIGLVLKAYLGQGQEVGSDQRRSRPQPLIYQMLPVAKEWHAVQLRIARGFESSVPEYDALLQLSDELGAYAGPRRDERRLHEALDVHCR
jgi:hypothetical protein